MLQILKQFFFGLRDALRFTNKIPQFKKKLFSCAAFFGMSAPGWRDLIRQSGHLQILRACAILQTFSGILLLYNICCIFIEQRNLSKIALGLRSFIAVVEGIVGSLSLFYFEQSETMFQLYQAFVCLAAVDIFLSASSIIISIFTCSSTITAAEAIQKENEESKEDKAGLILRELADKSFTVCTSTCIILGLMIAMALDATIVAYGWDYTFGTKVIKL